MPTPQFIAALRKKVGHDLLLLPTIVVIVRDPNGHVLLVHDRDANQWTLPGGIIEPGETPADAAVREVWEETSVLATLTHIVGVVGGHGCETHYGNGDKIAWVATIFAASVSRCVVPTSDGMETSAARFVAPHELGTMAIRPDSLHFLKAEQSSADGAYFQAPTWRPG
jgi:8-oxo-dGTP pyrophosphatase MutT (NUDIX family)